MFQFNFSLSWEDYYAFGKHCSRHDPATKQARLRSRIAYPILCLVIAALCPFVSPGSAIMSAAFIALALLWLLTYDARADRRIKKSMQKQTFDEGPITYCFEEKAFTRTSKSQTLTNTYADIARVDVGEQAVYLCESSPRSFMLPNRAFADEEEKGRFVSFVRGKINEGKEEREEA